MFSNYNYKHVTCQMLEYFIFSFLIKKIVLYKLSWAYFFVNIHYTCTDECFAYFKKKNTWILYLTKKLNSK